MLQWNDPPVQIIEPFVGPFAGVVGLFERPDDFEPFDRIPGHDYAKTHFFLPCGMTSSVLRCLMYSSVILMLWCPRSCCAACGSSMSVATLLYDVNTAL